MMARTSRRRHLLTLLLLAPLAARAQLSSVPDLTSATNTQASTGTQTNGQTTGQTTGKATQTSDGTKTAQNTDTSSTQGTFKLTDAPKLNTGSSSSSADLRSPAGSLTESAFHLTGLPTIAGAGIPTLVIPFTANAPYMQKSSLPEGTFFIAVGGVLAFLGACVLLWRGLVAWSINRSVKRTALASMELNEKQPRSGSYWRSSSNNNGYNRVSTGGKGASAFYKDVGASSVSLDNLTSAGKTSKPHFRDSVTERHPSSNAPPPNLFFSPTAQVTQNRDSTHRSSGYMPSGYYASPAAAQAAGGHASTTIGGLAPHSSRYSTVSGQSGPSPPASPGLPPQSRGSTIAPRDTRSRDGLRAPPSRDGYSSNRNSFYLYAQPSTSSHMVGSNSVSDLAPSRAPSAYLEELFDNHGNGPRERF